MTLRSPQVNDELLSQPEVNPGPPDRDKDAPSNLEVNPGPPDRDKDAPSNLEVDPGPPDRDKDAPSNLEVNPGPPDRDIHAPSNLEVNPGPLERDKPVYFLSEENFPPLGKSGTMGDHKLIPKGRSSQGKNPPPLEKSGAPKLLSFPFKKISFMDPFYKFIL